MDSSYRGKFFKNAVSVCLCSAVHVKPYVMDRLNESHFSFKCPMNLEDMQATAHGRFCGKCQKEVFDLTNCSVEEVRALEQKHGPLCGSIRMAQVATVAIALASAACDKKPNSTPTVGLIVAPPSQHEESAKTPPQPTAGSISLPPVRQDGKASEIDEISAPRTIGKIKLPPKKEDDEAESPDQKSTPPSE